ncbi:MAG: Rid family hydrolase [Rhodanobacter sp.]|nr:Rid family hydrolase [Rhodanobacter sp.]
MIIDRRTLPGVLFAALLTPLAAGAATPPAHAEFYPSSDPALKALPFSEAVRAGDLLFVSGQIGSVPGKMALVPGGITAEAGRAIENVRSVLQRHGATLRDVVKCTAFLADMKDWPAFNGVYRQYFKAPFPARSATGATGLALGARVELECIAYAPVAPR